MIKSLKYVGVGGGLGQWQHRGPQKHVGTQYRSFEPLLYQALTSYMGVLGKPNPALPAR